MTTDEMLDSIKELTSKYQTLCDELLEALRVSLLENMDLRKNIKELNEHLGEAVDEIERLRKELEVYKDLYATELLKGKQ